MSMPPRPPMGGAGGASGAQGHHGQRRHSNNNQHQIQHPIDGMWGGLGQAASLDGGARHLGPQQQLVMLGLGMGGGPAGHVHPSVVQQLSYEASLLADKMMKMRIAKQELESELSDLKAARIRQVEGLERLLEIEEQLISEVGELVAFKRALMRELPHFEPRARASAALAVVQGYLEGEVGRLTGGGAGRDGSAAPLGCSAGLSNGLLPAPRWRHAQEQPPASAAAASSEEALAAAVSVMSVADRPAAPAPMQASPSQHTQVPQQQLQAPAVQWSTAPAAVEGLVDGTTIMDLLDYLSSTPMDAAGHAQLLAIMGGAAPAPAAPPASAAELLSAFSQPALQAMAAPAPAQAHCPAQAQQQQQQAAGRSSSTGSVALPGSGGGWAGGSSMPRGQLPWEALLAARRSASGTDPASMLISM